MTFSDKIEDNDAVVLQMKDEEWGGAFVDYFEDRVPDKAFLGLSWRSLRLVSVYKFMKCMAW